MNGSIEARRTTRLVEGVHQFQGQRTRTGTWRRDPTDSSMEQVLVASGGTQLGSIDREGISDHWSVGCRRTHRRP
jgi:hypothetical protein